MPAMDSMSMPMVMREGKACCGFFKDNMYVCVCGVGEKRRAVCVDFFNIICIW